MADLSAGACSRVARARDRALAAVLAAVAGTAGAATDLVIDDVRVEYGRSPQTYTVSGGADLDTRARRFGVQYVHSFDRVTGSGSYLGGVELSATSAPGSTDADGHVRTAMVDAMLGYGWAPWRAVHGEFTPYLGVGRSDLARDGVHARSTAIEIGVRGAVLWTTPLGVQVGVDVRYVDGYWHPTIAGRSTTVQDKGLVAMAVLGYRF